MLMLKRVIFYLYYGHVSFFRATRNQHDVMKYKESVSRFHPIAALSGLPSISACSCLVKSPNTPTPDEQQTDFRFVATSLNLRIPSRVVWGVERTAAIHHSAVMMVTLAGHCCHPVYCTQTGAKLQGDHSLYHCRLS